MPERPDQLRLSPAEIAAFLGRTPPFADLEEPLRRRLAGRLTVEAYPRSVCILRRGESEIKHLRLIYQGGVKLYLQAPDGEERFIERRGPGEAVGALGILRRSRSNLSAETADATVFLLLERAEFLDLFRRHPAFAQHYLDKVSESYVDKAFTQLQGPLAGQPREGSLYLFSALAGDLVRRPPLTVPWSTPVQAAAARMSEARVGSLLIGDQGGEPVGIITDRDLRTKVVAQGLDYLTPVGRIMSHPIRAIPAHTTCFDALLEMMRRRCHHLALERQGRISGILSAHDLMVLQGTSPLYLLKEINDQDRLEGLHDLSRKTPRMVRSLIQEGAKAGHVTRLITLLNDMILERLLTLLEDKLGSPPLPYCFLLLGSEGRREQTFHTDQDNGLIYRDPEGPVEEKAAADYFAALGEAAIEHLVKAGYPRCRGEVMASNPKWRQPYSAWACYFEQWIHKPRPREVLQATIFFDFRPGYGDQSLGQDLRDHLFHELAGQDVFLRHLAEDTLHTPPALGFLQRFNLEKDGPRKGRLNLKLKGLTPFVDFARVMALKHRVRETNTIDRLALLGEAGAVSPEFSQTAGQAYEFQMQLRLIHQLRQVDQGQEPDNYLDPGELSDLERRTLKEALGVIGQIKSYFKEAFRLQG